MESLCAFQARRGYLHTLFRPAFGQVSQRAASYPHSSTPSTLFASNQRVSPFSSSAQLLARKKKEKKDLRITLIRYHLQHPRLPRPLRFSRLRYLRHWTIHRAWQLWKLQQRRAHELALERQFYSIRAACEALRLTGEDGLSIAPPTWGPPDVRLAKAAGGVEVDVGAAAEMQREVGRLYRIAMMNDGVWDSVPIEYARSQTDTPPRAGWDYSWTR